MRKVLYLELVVDGEVYDTLDMYDATEDYENAYKVASEELDWCNNQEWFEEHIEGEIDPAECKWTLRISEISY